MKKSYIIKLTLWMLFVGFIVGCKDYDPDISTSSANQEFSALEILERSGQSLFLSAVEHAGVASELFASTDTTTVFAPSNEAFLTYMETAGVSSITEIDADALADVLRYHTTNAAFTSGSTDQSLTSLITGKSLYPTYSADGSIGINGTAAIVDADLYNSNGVVHVISAVLTAPVSDIMTSLSGDDDYSDFVAGLERVGLDATLSGSTEYTVFAPKNADLDDLSVLTDEEVTDYLSFMIVSGRVYSSELADGRIATLLGTTAGDKVQEIVVSGGSPNGVGFVADSANVSTDNGVVHYVDGAVETSTEMHTFIFFNSGYFSTTYTDAGIDSAYTDVSVDYNVIQDLFGGPTSGSFADDDERIDFVQAHTFDGSVALDDLSHGEKFTSVGDDIYWMQLLDGDPFIMGSVEVAGSAGAYNGTYYFTLGDGFATPAPDSTISEILAEKNGYQLIGKAIEVAELEGIVDAANTTFYAISDADFTAEFTYDDVADMDTLSTEDQFDTDAIAAFTDLINRHTVQGAVDGFAALNANTPTQVNVEGRELFWGIVGGVPVVINTPTNPASDSYGLDDSDFWASNGVIHVIDALIEEVEE